MLQCSHIVATPEVLKFGRIELSVGKNDTEGLADNEKKGRKRS